MTHSPPRKGRPATPETVRRSLRALAEGSAPGRGPSVSTGTAAPPESTPTGTAAPPESVVDDAERAAADAQTAAAFLSTDRLPRLDAAIATAAARGDDPIVERGRAARESLRRLAVALEGSPR